jgi:DNA-binding NtrC family response regulator
MNPKNPPSVLVIEDDDALRGLIGRALERSGYQIYLAGNSDEAGTLWAANKDSIGLIVADIVTPGLSGPELVREFADDKPGLKVIFMSGERRDATLEMTALVKGARFLPKPFAVEKLLQTVREELGN